MSDPVSAADIGVDPAPELEGEELVEFVTREVLNQVVPAVIAALSGNGASCSAQDGFDLASLPIGNRTLH